MMIARTGRSTRFEIRQRALAAGQRAERLAALYLRLKGYRILARRYCVRGGEIDLIARRRFDHRLHRSEISPDAAEAMTAIDARNSAAYLRAAAIWLAANPWAAP